MDCGIVELPWNRLTTLKRAFRLAAEDIEVQCKAEKAEKCDSLHILVALARLMEKPNPNLEEFDKLGCKLDDAKTVGKEWVKGNFAQAKNLLQDLLRQAALDDVTKESAGHICRSHSVTYYRGTATLTTTPSGLALGG